MDLKLRRQNGEIFDGILSLSNMVDDKKVLSGYVCLINDITERKALENKKEILIRELQAALDQVKTLRGLLPICASCKKIRDDQGYWNNLETYITVNSGASFSHSICPDCARKLYGYENEEKEDDTGSAQ